MKIYLVIASTLNGDCLPLAYYVAKADADRRVDRLNDGAAAAVYKELGIDQFGVDEIEVIEPLGEESA